MIDRFLGKIYRNKTGRTHMKILTLISQGSISSPLFLFFLFNVIYLFF